MMCAMVGKAPPVAHEAAKKAHASAVCSPRNLGEEIVPLKCCLVSKSLPWEHNASDLFKAPNQWPEASDSHHQLCWCRRQPRLERNLGLSPPVASFEDFFQPILLFPNSLMYLSSLRRFVSITSLSNKETIPEWVLLDKLDPFDKEKLLLEVAEPGWEETYQSDRNSKCLNSNKLLTEGTPLPLLQHSKGDKRSEAFLKRPLWRFENVTMQDLGHPIGLISIFRLLLPIVVVSLQDQTKRKLSGFLERISERLEETSCIQLYGNLTAQMQSYCERGDHRWNLMSVCLFFWRKHRMFIEFKK